MPLERIWELLDITKKRQNPVPTYSEYNTIQAVGCMAMLTPTPLDCEHHQLSITAKLLWSKLQCQAIMLNCLQHEAAYFPTKENNRKICGFCICNSCSNARVYLYDLYSPSDNILSCHKTNQPSPVPLIVDHLFVHTLCQGRCRFLLLRERGVQGVDLRR